MNNNEELVKSLTSLIDETLEEIEEIKKSKFAAAEIKIEGPGEGIAGKPTNGSLDAKKKEDDESEDEDDKKKKMDKGENEKADPDHGKFAKAPSVAKGENEKADPDHGKFSKAPTVAKGEDESEDEDEDKKDMKKDMKKEMKKSVSESEDLIKSYVDSRFGYLEEKLSKMAAAIEAMADAPVARRGVPAGFRPLSKSSDEHSTPLSKSDVASALFELKKSGTNVDSTDIFKVESAKNINEVYEIASKYGLK